MDAIWDQIQTFFWNIINRPTWVDYLDIGIMAVLIYQLFLITRRTRSMQVFKGLIILIFASYLSGILGLTSINYLLQGVLSNGIIVILILFQPEVKRTLEYLDKDFEGLCFINLVDYPQHAWVLQCYKCYKRMQSASEGIVEGVH